MIYSLRRFGALSGALLFIWCFYYLGSQACAREYKLVDSKPFHKAKLGMITPTAQSSLVGSTATSQELAQQYLLSDQALISHYNFQFGSKTLEGTGLPYDMFGNTRVPLIESMDSSQVSKLDKVINKVENASGNEQAPWLRVATASDQAYTAFDGPKLWQNYSQNEFFKNAVGDGDLYDDLQQFLGNLEFTTSYTYVDCSTPVIHAYSAFPNGTSNDAVLAINFTRNDRGYNSSGQPTKPKQFEYWGRWNDTGDTDLFPDPVVNPIGSFVATCNLTTSYIDVQANCQPQGCSAKKVRYSDAYPTYDPVTPFDNDTFADIFFNHMLSSMGPQTLEYLPGQFLSTGIVADGGPIDLDSLTQDFVEGETDNETLQEDMQDYLAHGLVQVINTYYRSSLSGDCIYRDNKPGENCKYFTGKGAVYDPQYLLSIPWIIMDFISCFILLAAAVFSYWLRTRTLAPDIFGYVSSLTRENPHFDLPTDTGSALSGLDRTRALADVKIKIGGYTQENGLPRVIVSHVCEGYEANALHGDAKYA